MSQQSPTLESKIKQHEDDKDNDTYDTIIIGAGLTGINAAHRITTELPHHRYVILERRSELGGTWSFFKYPGIRSDSDLYTMGFAWKPWTKSTPIADGPAIVEYMTQTAREYGIDKRIQYGHEVVSLDWRSDEQRWNLRVRVDGKDQKVIHARFVVAGTGFFDYNEPRQTEIPGIKDFKGIVAHPQFWSEKIDYEGKNVAIIGSGATAVTIFPVVAQKAAKTTLIQRSPTYIMSMPMKSSLDDTLRAHLPFWLAFTIIRWRFTLMAWLFFYFTQFFPDLAKKALRAATTKELPPTLPYEPDFSPTYKVWDQRLCVCPDGDFFKALHNPTATVKTATITSIKDHTIYLSTGETLPDTDIIVTATGLKLLLLGGARLTLNSNPTPITISDQYMWRGTMLQSIPNLMLVIGYWNNSWMLGSDLAVRIFIKTIQRAEREGYTSFTPTISDEEMEGMKGRERPLWNMTSTYLKSKVYPRASERAPWSVKDNYLRDWWAMKRGNLVGGLRFERGGEVR